MTVADLICIGIIIFLAFSIVLVKVEMHIAVEKTLKDRIDRIPMAWCLAISAFHLWIMLLAFREHHLGEHLLFLMPAKRMSFFDCVWTIVMNGIASLLLCPGGSSSSRRFLTLSDQSRYSRPLYDGLL